MPQPDITIPAVSRHPLTEAQEGLWYAQAVDPGSPVLNTGQYLDLRGPLNHPAMMESLRRALAETEALRLRFAQGGDDTVQWLDPSQLLPVALDLSGDPDPQGAALAWMQADSGRPIDLATDPLACFALIRLGEGRHLLYERIHHLAIDGYGMVLVTNRIAEHYDALVKGAPPPAPYPPYAAALQADADWRADPRRDAARDWWHRNLTALPEAGGPSAGTAASARSFLREGDQLDSDLAGRLGAWAKAHDLNWADVLTGLTAAYVARWSGGTAVVGLPFMARLGRPVARVPCMAMNVLPQRVTLDEDRPTPDWLAALAAEMRAARRHGLYRSEYLRRELGLIGGARRLYGPLVNVQPFDRAPRFVGLDAGLHILGAGAVDDLTLTFRGDPASGLLFEVDANPGLYTPDDVRGHARRLPAFLAAALDAPTLATVPTASGPEIAAADSITRAAEHAVPDTTLAALIEQQMAATPGAPALSSGDVTLSYRDLDRMTAALAGRLVQLGAGRDAIVGVLLDRSVHLTAALVAVLRAGAAYLPLEPDHPPDRIAGIIAQARPVVVLTDDDLSGLLPPGVPALLTRDWPAEGAVSARPAPGDLAYVIFTSGSTGAPKGVAIEHRAIVNRLLWMGAAYGFGPADRILQKTPATFDVSVWEFFLPLITGGHLVMAPPGAHRDPTRIASLIRRHAITTLHFVPSMLSAFLAAPASKGLRLSRVFCSGEELTADQRDRFHARITAGLYNLYGPTEAAVDVSHWTAGPDDSSAPVPIGWPVWNTRLAVLDDRMRPQPPGLAGHLYLGGVQLARGYLGRDDLTAERFVTHQGQRLYATGDLARLRHDGAVEYLGRSDHQVKIRGLRIELGEIEAAIMATGLARECVVVARRDESDARLVAYLVPEPDYRPGDLARALALVLPGYMVPGAEMALDAMPVTSNGKLDRKSLPAPDRQCAGRPAQGAAETLLARLYAEVLGLPDTPPAEADFFALGGDSLSAVRLDLRIEEETGRAVGLGTIFEAPILSALAEAMAQGTVSDGLGPVILLADGDADAPPLFLIHPAGGLGWCYRHLARLVAPARRVWAIQHPGLDPDAVMPASITDLAQDYAARIAALVPAGPVHLAGWSLGGIIAHEMALTLQGQGRQPGLVAALDAYPADVWRDEPEPDPAAALRALLAIAGHDPDAHPELDTRQRVVAFLRDGDTALGTLPERVLDGVVRTVTDTNRLIRNHHHRRMDGTLTHIRAGLDHEGRDFTAALWHPYAAEVDALSVPFLHAHMTSPVAAEEVARILAERMH